VLLSGVFEIAPAIRLPIPKTSRFAAWGRISLLIAVFPANLHIDQHQHQQSFPLPPILRLLGLPLQGLLIFWAYTCIRPR
jgi:uncharacterized membrane protein